MRKRQISGGLSDVSETTIESWINWLRKMCRGFEFKCILNNVKISCFLKASLPSDLRAQGKQWKLHYFRQVTAGAKVQQLGYFLDAKSLMQIDIKKMVLIEIQQEDKNVISLLDNAQVYPESLVRKYKKYEGLVYPLD